MNTTSHHPGATRTKYRPVLTAAQILHIITCLKQEAPLTDIGFSCLTSLVPFKDKITAGTVTPSYTAASTASVDSVETSLAALGYPGEQEHPDEHPRTKEQLWEECYKKYTESPSNCSAGQIESAFEHMYLNDLMSPAEMAEFEAPTDTIDTIDSADIGEK